jgi:hypothetical protein
MEYRDLPKMTVSDGGAFRTTPKNTGRVGYKVSQKVYHTNGTSHLRRKYFDAPPQRRLCDQEDRRLHLGDSIEPPSSAAEQFCDLRPEFTDHSVEARQSRDQRSKPVLPGPCDVLEHIILKKVIGALE